MPVVSSIRARLKTGTILPWVSREELEKLFGGQNVARRTVLTTRSIFFLPSALKSPMTAPSISTSRASTEVPGAESVGFETVAVGNDTDLRIGQLDRRHRTDLGTLAMVCAELAKDGSCGSDDPVEIITADIHFDAAAPPRLL